MCDRESVTNIRFHTPVNPQLTLPNKELTRAIRTTWLSTLLLGKLAALSFNFLNCCCLIAMFCPALVWTHGLQPGSSVHGIPQAWILGWVAISFFRGSSWPRDWPCVSCIGRWIWCHWITSEAPSHLWNGYKNNDSILGLRENWGSKCM